MDPKARDQYIALAGDEVHISWNNKSEEPELVHKHSNWTDTYLQWSTYGSYISTFHKQGIALWGGQSWQRLFRLIHPNVKLIEFSPCENYLVTWSNEAIAGKDEVGIQGGWCKSYRWLRTSVSGISEREPYSEVSPRPTPKISSGPTSDGRMMASIVLAPLPMVSPSTNCPKSSCSTTKSSRLKA